MMNRENRRLGQHADYTGPNFRDLNLWLPELFRLNLQRTRQNVMHGMTFTNCQIEGPAVIVALGGVQFDACNLGDAKGDMRTLLLRPLAADKVTGAVALQDCRFVDCDFYAIGYTGPESFLQQLLQVPTPPAETPA